MGVITKFVELTWNNSIDKRYKNLGYFYSGYQQPFKVDIRDLAKSSEKEILVQCDTCLSEKKIPYSSYTASKCYSAYGFGKYFCKPCATKHFQGKSDEKFKNEVHSLVGDEYTIIGIYEKSNKEIAITHNKCGRSYQVRPANFLSGDRCRKCSVEKNTLLRKRSQKEWENEVFNLVGNEYSVVGEYIGKDIPLLMKHHKCDIIYPVTPGNFKQGKRCPTCQREKNKGEGNYNWKGGISSVSEFLRSKLIDWKKESIKNSGYKCVISGKRFDVIHHLYGFDKIINELFEITGYDIREKISDYESYELEKLKRSCIELHTKYPLGVCLTKEIHVLYHSIYGYGNNVPEQFEEFKSRFIKGEFENYIVENKQYIS